MPRKSNLFFLPRRRKRRGGKQINFINYILIMYILIILRVYKIIYVLCCLKMYICSFRACTPEGHCASYVSSPNVTLATGSQRPVGRARACEVFPVASQGPVQAICACHARPLHPNSILLLACTNCTPALCTFLSPPR